ncbi:DUF6122 family protein [Chromatocurvus halotolerans]|uniref:LexA-binding, inner membrane-associated hydrolase n=1 Tax=Chromatocurvus halotolerans TaxID=1132028 RepID=A0A4R2KB48_9GAMM|nr:DUF6122 family protein [Chromatocurvus halotolerans]TCO70701.1 hypothetical protein EV688_12512 [Chromatocurvus halotolerans]
MLHIALHFIVPLLVALAVYRPRWRSATLIMAATMLVDVDHLLADPVYDPDRCSIGFHPLHSTETIAVYAALFAIPLLLRRTAVAEPLGKALGVVHLAGLGLLIHMALDALDCVV